MLFKLYNYEVNINTIVHYDSDIHIKINNIPSYKYLHIFHINRKCVITIIKKKKLNYFEIIIPVDFTSEVII